MKKLKEKQELERAQVRLKHLLLTPIKLHPLELDKIVAPAKDLL